MPGIALGNFVTTTTRQRFFEKAIDNIFEGNVLFNRLRSRARPWTGGTQLRITTTVANRTQSKSFSGFDTFPTAQEDVRQQFTINPSEYVSDPLTFSGIQLAVNKGPEAYINLMATEFSDVARNLSEKMGADLYLDGTGNANKDIAGLTYHVDDTTNVVTYQGLSRTTYSNLRSLLTVNSAAFTFANLATDTDAAQRGSDNPTVMITTPAVFSIIERLVTPTVNVNYGQMLPQGAPTGENQGIALNYGVNRLFWRGVPIIADEKCTSGNLYTLNENHLFLYELSYTPEMVETSKEGFAFTGFKKSQNQNAVVGHMMWAGQLVGDSPRTMARRTTITS